MRCAVVLESGRTSDVPQKIIPLSELDAHWLPDPKEVGGRWGEGIGFHCPVHSDHRCYLYFRTPLDGGKSKHLQMLYDVDHVHLGNTKEAFADISIYPIGNDSRPIQAPCGAVFWVVGGSCILPVYRWWQSAY